jgi:DNA-binding transcriptional MerR regulator
MQDKTFDIQGLVKASGVARRTIYFYVQQGLLPPPEGAGLAAYYTGQHLTRLQLIPILREQGLRLDEIRQRFSHMTPEEMQGMLAAQPAASPPRPVPGETLSLQLDRSTPARRTGDEQLPAERQFIHYQLPAGISLVAPVDLPQPEQMQLRLLLQSAAQIFAAQIVYKEPPASRHGENGQTDSNPEDLA